MLVIYSRSFPDNITMPDNYLILQDDDLFNIRRKKCRIVYHKPIWPDGKGDEDVKKDEAVLSKKIDLCGY